MNQRIVSQVKFHDYLHSFIAKQGIGTVCIERNKANATVFKFGTKVFVCCLSQSQESYTVNCGRLLEIQEGYGKLQLEYYIVRQYYHKFFPNQIPMFGPNVWSTLCMDFIIKFFIILLTCQQSNYGMEGTSISWLMILSGAANYSQFKCVLHKDDSKS